MPYDIHLPYDLELRLRRVFGGLSKEEKEIYDSIRRLSSISNNGASLQELCVGRQEIQTAYSNYFSCNQSRCKPFFHGRLKDLRIILNNRIKALEEEIEKIKARNKRKFTIEYLN